MGYYFISGGYVKLNANPFHNLIESKKITVAKVDTKNDFKPVAATSTRSYSDITIRLTKKFDERREIIFEDSFGEEKTVLEPFTIITAGIGR